MTSAELNAKILGHAVNIGIAAGGVLPAANDPWWLAGRVAGAALALTEFELSESGVLGAVDYQLLVGELGHFAAAGHFRGQPAVVWRDARSFDPAVVREAFMRARAIVTSDLVARSLGNAAADFLARVRAIESEATMRAGDEARAEDPES